LFTFVNDLKNVWIDQVAANAASIHATPNLEVSAHAAPIGAPTVFAEPVINAVLRAVACD